MIHELPADAAPMIDRAYLDAPQVRLYLDALDKEAPGLDLTWDRAIVAGILAATEARAGRLQHHREVAAVTFDSDEYATLIAAALVFLLPGSIPPELIPETV